MTRPFLSAEWRDLAMLNYAVSPDLLHPLVPSGTELDDWHGTTYLSVVGFRFVSTRVLGFPIPGHRDFEEVNLRFYVRRHAPDGWRRGVVFIKELVPRRAIAWVARAWYNEPYRALPMRHAIDRSRSDGSTAVHYEWKTERQWEGVRVVTDGSSAPLESGSEAEFITEHYWGYTRQRNGSTLEHQVTHPSWRVTPCRSAELYANVSMLYGSPFETVLSASPQSAFLAEGSAIVVYRPSTLPFP